MTIVDEAAGWPALSLWSGWGEHEVSERPQHGKELQRVTWGIRIKSPDAVGKNGKALPLHPIWPGFAINTMFYAVLIGGAWLLFVIPRALRRKRRIEGR